MATDPEIVLFDEPTSALDPELVGEVLEVIDTGDPCYACMLGGDDGKTLFMLTAKTSVGHEAARKPQGRVLVATVDSPGAGRP